MEIQSGEKPFHTQKSSLKTNDSTENSKLKQACADFEAILLDSMFQSMKKTLSGDDIFGKSLGRDIFESMYYTQMSKDLATKGNGLGLGENLYQQLSSQMKNSHQDEAVPKSNPGDQLQKYRQNSDTSIDAK